MSFRSRLTLFFGLIVVVPMVSVAFVVFRLIEDNERGKADASVSARRDAAIGAQNAARLRADAAAIDIGTDRRLAAALRAGDRPALRVRAEALLDRERARRILVRRGAEVVVDVGSPRAIIPAARELQDAGGGGFGTLYVSVTGPREFTSLVKEATKLEVVVLRGTEVLAASDERLGGARFPLRPSSVEIAGRSYRTASFGIPDFGRGARVVLIEPPEAVADEVDAGRRAFGGILLGFFVLACGFAVLVSRSLQQQIGAFLIVARRLAAGDFSAKVPTSGRDEFAALGSEFNNMAQQLEARLEDLAEERARLQNAMRRIGETFASNLDRDALLEIFVQTAVDGVGAQAGRATVRPRPAAGLREVVSAGQDGMGEALRNAEAQVLETTGIAEVEVDGVHALAHPLRGGDSGEHVMGVVAVARHGAQFGAGDRELFEYLAAQAAVSLENVGLHETVERQAVTDELTGLSNRRRFDEALAAEVERSRRFRQPMALLLLDIDNFKKVNDSYGHQQGDLVLQEVARILRETCREIDEPARYGGEELAAVLPGTDLDGAYRLAERVRVQLEELDISMRPGARRRKPMRVTASFGVATVTGNAADVPSLLAAADEAMYRAKRAGKNRVERAVTADPVAGD